MTTTTIDTPARPSSPTTTPANPEHTTPAAPTTATNNPFETTDTHSLPPPAVDERTEASNIPSQTSEANQPISAPEEQPARPQVTDTNAERISPEVESLKAMFPDFDTSILQSVLESVNGDQERAADVLLGMSDPSYVSQQPSERSQTELDEEYARRLVLEEQQRASWHPDQPYPGPTVPYQPRVQGPHQGHQPQWRSGSPPQQGGAGRDTMTEVQEQFTKIAETGKKTFSSLMTKVKAKMQEFDSKNQSGSTQQPPQQTYWGSGAASGAGPLHTQTDYGSPIQPSPPQQGARSPPPFESVQGYDAQPPSAAGTGLGLSGAAPPATSSSPVSVPAPAPAPADRIPPRPPSAGNVDPSKIGMLPKRPVSLLDSQASSQTQTRTQTQPAANTATRRDDDDDELDYVENPFEEGGRK